MATTVPDAIPTPDATDVYKLTIDLKAMADRIQVLLTQLRSDLTVRDTGWYSDSDLITAATGWEVGSSGSNSYRRIGAWAFVRYVQVSRTGGAINVPSTGDTPNTVVANLVAGGRSPGRPDQAQPIGSASTGRMGAYEARANGDIAVVAVGGTANIATGESLSFGGSWTTAAPFPTI